MELEMKYRIPDKDTADQIEHDAYLFSICDPSSREKVYMKAAYFDTEDHILMQHDMAFRIRMEGQLIVASLKWNGVSHHGLHSREEINVPVNDEGCFLKPDPRIFIESGPGQHLLELIGDRPLVSVLEISFLRTKMRADTGDCICEVAIDVGEIITDAGNEPIMELEIELFSGEDSCIETIGRKIAETYGLEAEDRTKYARGLRLAGLI